MSHRALPLLLLLALAAGAAAWWWADHRPTDRGWQGYADADFIRVGPTQQGLLTAVLVRRGDRVGAGTRLFDQDDTADRAARDQAAQLLAQALQQAANLRQGGKPTEIDQAAANLAETRAILVRTAADLARARSLLPTGVVTRQSVDQAEADFQSARAKVESLQAALAQARAPLGRQWEIEAQVAAAAAAREALKEANWRLDQRHVAAPADAWVADVLAQPGETVAAGAPVVSLLAPANLFVRFFIPASALPTVHLGQPVALACDGCPAGLTASVSFIAPQAEYTPPLIYSKSTTAKLVFLVEARPPADQAGRLNPGQPVRVRPLPEVQP